MQKLIYSILLFVFFVGGGLIIVFKASQEVKIGQSFTLEDESKKAEAQEHIEIDPEDPEAAAAAASQKESQREADLKLFLEEPYFRLPVLTIPILRNEQLYGILHLRIIMKSTGHQGFQIAKVVLPRLTDAIYSDLYKAFANLWIVKYDPSPAVLQKRIKYVAQKTLSKEVIEEVLLREFFFTRMK